MRYLLMFYLLLLTPGCDYAPTEHDHDHSHEHTHNLESHDHDHTHDTDHTHEQYANHSGICSRYDVDIDDYFLNYDNQYYEYSCYSIPITQNCTSTSSNKNAFFDSDPIQTCQDACVYYLNQLFDYNYFEDESNDMLVSGTFKIENEDSVLDSLEIDFATFVGSPGYVYDSELTDSTYISNKISELCQAYAE